MAAFVLHVYFNMIRRICQYIYVSKFFVYLDIFMKILNLEKSGEDKPRRHSLIFISFQLVIQALPLLPSEWAQIRFANNLEFLR